MRSYSSHQEGRLIYHSTCSASCVIGSCIITTLYHIWEVKGS